MNQSKRAEHQLPSRGLSAFLTGLDAWQAGNAGRAVEALDAR